MKLHLLSGAIQIKTNCLKKLMKALKKSCGRILAVRQFLYMGFESLQPKIIKIAKQINICFAILVRWKGLEPPTYWFVASHSIQLSYQRVYVLHFLCFNTITQIKSKCNTFFIFCKDYLKYIFRVYHRRVLQVQGKGAFCNTLLCVFRQSVNPAPALKCQEAHGI